MLSIIKNVNLNMFDCIIKKIKDIVKKYFYEKKKE